MLTSNVLYLVWLFATPWTAARQASLSITNSQSLLNSCPLSRWCHLTISSSVIPVSCFQFFPASGSFQMNQFLVACSLKYTWRPIPPEPYVPGSVMFDSETPWSVTSQAPLSMEFSRQEYWTGLPFPPPGDFPDPGIKCVCPATGRQILYH